MDVKGTKRLNNLIYPALKYPPKMAPDWYVLAWVVNLGHSFEVELVGCCKFAHFDEVRRPVMLNTLVWFMPYSDLMPMADQVRRAVIVWIVSVVIIVDVLFAMLRWVF